MSVYSNQFDKTPVPGQLDLSRCPEGSIIHVRYNPEATSTLTMLPGEGCLLTDLGASDMDAQGIPIVDKRTNDYDRLYGIKTFNIKKNANSPGESFDVARPGAVMYFQCHEAISRGSKVSLNLSYIGQIQNVTTGYTTIGVALDKGVTNNIIRVELYQADTAVAAT